MRDELRLAADPCAGTRYVGSAALPRGLGSGMIQVFELAPRSGTTRLEALEQSAS